MTQNKNLKQLVLSATSQQLKSPKWELNFEIINILLGQPDKFDNYKKLLVKQLKTKKIETQYLTLQLIRVTVQESKKFLDGIDNEKFFKHIRKIITSKKECQARAYSRYLLKKWAKKSKNNYLKNEFKKMLSLKYEIPNDYEIPEAPRMLTNLKNARKILILNGKKFNFNVFLKELKVMKKTAINLQDILVNSNTKIDFANSHLLTILYNNCKYYQSQIRIYIQNEEPNPTLMIEVLEISDEIISSIKFYDEIRLKGTVSFRLKNLFYEKHPEKLPKISNNDQFKEKPRKQGGGKSQEKEEIVLIDINDKNVNDLMVSLGFTYHLQELSFQNEDQETLINSKYEKIKSHEKKKNFSKSKKLNK
ncbi:tom1-like protein [Anaeramoeba flamelloides]|uniref:Tom1-like protein n=1 Tax=Anaeramoeba flamelloides TaxID=1746091 RepID=A0ABQ8YYS6_9EUKA|nr:tom1-like protein [Anaeramoeba flamelloides]